MLLAPSTSEPGLTYERLRAGFRWKVPIHFNIGLACSDVWAAREASRPALIAFDGNHRATVTTYGELARLSDAFGGALRAHGIGRGDRVAILLPQGLDTLVAHLATYKIGAVAVPLAALFGPEALAFRLAFSGARAVITSAHGAERLAQITRPAALETVIRTDAPDGEALHMGAMIAAFRGEFRAEPTLADDPALMIFTSGTTGAPKAALHGHRVVPGHLPGLQTHHEFMPQPRDMMWTPADWAWAGGLLNALLPSLILGVPVVAGPFERFDPERAMALCAKAKVRNAFIPPTALRMLRQAGHMAGRFPQTLRSIGSAGEALGAETLEWGRSAFGLTINEFYGQTECNAVIGSMAALGVSKPGWIGKSLPGHDVAVIRADGTLCEAGERGEIAVRRPDPVMFLGYFNDPEATARKFTGGWMMTGDEGVMDGDGYIRFIGRNDDVITSAGYRIGPSEVEDCLIRHPAVALAAVVGVPDALRTEIVKAFIVLKPDARPSDALKADIQTFVRERLSAHEYPRAVSFISELPMTTSGKVIRRALRESA
ncbi:MAG: AMP-binding protein [Rhizobiaceae bacterium]|jgi:acetyl-CoA synthetase|nr:AMP-binding protein [Rhizobiaceae bacterium]